MAERLLTRAGPGLAVVRAVLADLDAAGVRYCHWKSNEHLLAALDGATDLDLLVADADRFRQVIDRHGFVEARNPPVRQIPGLADHLGFDADTGTLVHLHVHYRLVLGERHVKEHHLPIETWLLDALTRRHGVPIPTPERELLLLYLRCVLKSDALRPRGVPEPIRAELRHLLTRTPDRAVLDALRDSGLPLDPLRLRRFLDRARADRLSPGYLARAKHDLRRRLRRYERHRHPRAVLRRVGYRARFDSRVQRHLPIRRKALLDRGLYVAVVGADGAGKSRLATDLTAWLGRKLDTTRVYFGQPKRHRRLIALRRLARHVPRLQPMPWLYLARLRRRLDRAARARVARGGVVVAERFPLAEFGAMAVPMDGPRVRAGTWLGNVERRGYARIGRPDLVLALNATLPTLRARKPDTDPAEHAAKTAAVQALYPGDGLVFVDAEQPYSDVLLAAKRALWSALLATRCRR